MQEASGLRRQIGLTVATAVIVGEVIGVGIFLTPAEMARSLGSPFWLLIVWLFMGGMTLGGALCYGELSARYPRAGGGYVYLLEAYGPQVAFLYGWKCFLVMDPGITAALAVGLGSYAGYLFGLPPAGVKTVGIAAILGLAMVNISGVRPGASLMKWLTVFKLGLIGFIVFWGFGRGLGQWSNFIPFVEQRPGSAPLFGAIAGGLVGAFFSFAGWWEVSKMAGEVRDPARALPRALTMGVLAVTVVYILISAVFLYLVPLEQVTSSETFAAQAGESLFGRAGGQVFSSVVIVSVLGSLAGIVMTAPRVYYAMARDGLFPAGAGAIHPRFGTPFRAIALQALLASALVLVGSFNQIVAYFVFVTVIFIGLTVASVFVLRRKSGDAPVYLTPGYPATPVMFLALIVLLLVLLGGNSPKEASLGVAIVALGAPFYYLFFREERKNKL
ncbi:MAG TPA: amino acid permease [Blastocatellia bacterium]|nr:amino acid permease [Blastocatellia bacterium]